MRTRCLLACLTLVLAASPEAIAQAPPSGYDVFVVAGQSNAAGKGDSTLSPPVAPGVAFLYRDGALSPLLSDPLPRAYSGSAWPAFITAYHARTGRGVVVVAAAVSGSAVSSAANPQYHWGADGTLFWQAVAAGDSALIAALGAGLDARPAGWLWSQGERDAQRIDNGNMTVAVYEAGILDVLARYDTTSFGRAGAPFYVLRTGHRAGGDTAGFQGVRAVQDSLPPPAVMAYAGADTFPERGLMEDELHWSQLGLNEAGEAAAVVAAAWVPPTPGPRARLDPDARREASSPTRSPRVHRAPRR